MFALKTKRLHVGIHLDQEIFSDASNCVVKIKIDPQGLFHGNFQITEVLAIQTISR